MNNATAITTNLTHDSGILSATIDHGQVVVFDLPADRAGSPGTVTAQESADWTEQDWRRLATSRRQALRRRQRASNLIGPRSRMSPAYEAQVLRQREAARPKWSIVEERPHPWWPNLGRHIDVFYGSTLVETWRWEHVAGTAYPVWACYPAGHAFPTGYSDRAPNRRGVVA